MLCVCVQSMLGVPRKIFHGECHSYELSASALGRSRWGDAVSQKIRVEWFRCKNSSVLHVLIISLIVSYLCLICSKRYFYKGEKTWFHLYCCVCCIHGSFVYLCIDGLSPQSLGSVVSLCRQVVLWRVLARGFLFCYMGGGKGGEV